jgi:alanine racemase
MDMTMIDVSDIPCDIGDVATLIGADGEGQLTVADVARAGAVSPYELLTGLRQRLPHRYRESAT